MGGFTAFIEKQLFKCFCSAYTYTDSVYTCITRSICNAVHLKHTRSKIEIKNPTFCFSCPAECIPIYAAAMRHEWLLNVAQYVVQERSGQNETLTHAHTHTIDRKTYETLCRIIIIIVLNNKLNFSSIYTYMRTPSPLRFLLCVIRLPRIDTFRLFDLYATHLHDINQ